MILVVLIYTLVVLVEFLLIYIFEFENEHHDHDDDDDDGDVQDGRIITENWRLDPPEIWDIQYREIVRLAVPCTRMSCL